MCCVPLLIPLTITDTFIAEVRLVILLARKPIESLAGCRGQESGCGGHWGGAWPGVRVMDNLRELLEAVVHHWGLAIGCPVLLFIQ